MFAVGSAFQCMCEDFAKMRLWVKICILMRKSKPNKVFIFALLK